MRRTSPAPRFRTAVSGGRAQDWATIQEGQFAAAYHAVFDACGVGRDTRYCDVGCGSGMAAQLASQRGAAESGLDAAEGLLEIARARVPAGDFQLGDLEEPPFADGLFDMVTGFNSFQVAADPVRALAEAKRMAKPTGRIVVMTWGTPEGMPAAALVAALKPLLPPPTARRARPVCAVGGAGATRTGAAGGTATARDRGRRLPLGISRSGHGVAWAGLVGRGRQGGAGLEPGVRGRGACRGPRAVPAAEGRLPRRRLVPLAAGGALTAPPPSTPHRSICLATTLTIP